MSNKFSVLMSVYFKEEPKNLDLAINSVIDQTVMPNEIVLVEDGPLTKELDEIVDKYVKSYPSLFHVVKIEKNGGLGLALARGVNECKYDLIARMDSDDISRKDRFEIELKEFEKDPDLDICGSQIVEFDGDINNLLAKRIVPLKQEDIDRFNHRRSGFNHVTVMFKKATVLRAGNYQDFKSIEDHVLWSKMFVMGIKCKNIDDCLVYVRTGSNMIDRRGGLAYLKRYRNGKKEMLRIGYISYFDYLYAMAGQTFVTLAPKSVRTFVFNKLLRKSVD